MTNEPVIMLRWALGEAGLAAVVDQAPRRAVRVRMDPGSAAGLAALLGVDPRAIDVSLRAVHRIRVRTVEAGPEMTTVVLADEHGLRLADLITARTANASS
ncbi:hypothetical protein AB0O01_36040 [Streptomyces sp. NPDC093252]|uniref:hypothetical protein n=1 Tax=Streptomyces sp. NPDC093252 TaxID=3154980 RepID=UPI0034434AEA